MRATPNHPEKGQMTEKKKLARSLQSIIFMRAGAMSAGVSALSVSRNGHPLDTGTPRFVLTKQGLSELARD